MEELSEADEKRKSEIIDNLNKMLCNSFYKISELFKKNGDYGAIVHELNKAKYIKKMLGK